MGIIIDKIVFENYRQYGTGSLSFNSTPDGMLSVLIAKNGTGKTTLLNAITWCLYDKELHLADEKTALPLANMAVIRSAEEGDLIPVSVKMTIVDEANVVEFSRSVVCKVTSTGISPKVLTRNSKFVVSITPKGNFENTEVKQDADADIVVKQYFDEAIFKFYFFDGEKLRDYFSAGQSSSIKQSIFNISQVTMLENACSRLQKMRADRTKKIAKSNPDIEALNQAQEKYSSMQAVAEATLSQSQSDIIKLEEERDRLDGILRGYDPVKTLQKERQEREGELKKIEQDEYQYHVDRSSFIRQYLVLLNLYPRIRRTLDIIAEKEAGGDLPPAIDKNQVKKLLDHLDQPCPLCNHDIGETGRDHLETLLQQLSVSSHTSNYLKEIKAPLEGYDEKARRFKIELAALRERAIDIEDRKGKISKRLQEITSALSNFETEEGELNVAKTEHKRNEIINDINAAYSAIGAARTTIENCKTHLKKIEDDLKSALKKLTEHEDLKKQLAVIERMHGQFVLIKNKLMDEMRSEIEQTTWEFFDSMIWKRNTFGGIKISDTYEISVYNTDGAIMTGSLSATEQMALAYAFTLAIHKASGKNCPLVIDSPLGRVSDDNRESMARSLMDVSRNKQIVMLFTPDEYSEAVRQLYSNAATVRDLCLSSDESYVEGIDR